MRTKDWTKPVRAASRAAEEMTGRRQHGPGRALAMGIIGAVVGAVSAFLLDPQRGRARRAQLGDRTAAALRDAVTRFRRAARHLRSTVEGKASAVRNAGGSARETLNDVALTSKVASELLSDPDVPKGDININVEQGVVVLRGEVGDAAMRDRLERSAREIPGVWDVTNLLHLSGEAASMAR